MKKLLTTSFALIILAFPVCGQVQIIQKGEKLLHFGFGAGTYATRGYFKHKDHPGNGNYKGAFTVAQFPIKLKYGVIDKVGIGGFIQPMFGRGHSYDWHENDRIGGFCLGITGSYTFDILDPVGLVIGSDIGISSMSYRYLTNKGKDEYRYSMSGAFFSVYVAGRYNLNGQMALNLYIGASQSGYNTGKAKWNGNTYSGFDNNFRINGSDFGLSLTYKL